MAGSKGMEDLEEFRTAYQASVDQGSRLVTKLAGSEAPHVRLRSLPAAVQALACRAQRSLEQELAGETVGCGAGKAHGAERPALRLSPCDWVWRTLGR